jgi:hypothetical protein
MKRIEELDISEWTDTSLNLSQQQSMLTALESGKVIFIPKLRFELTAKEQRFLSPAYVNPKAKNISFDPRTQNLRGAVAYDEEYLELKNMVARFAQQAHQLINNLFPHYTPNLQVARTSFRPVEISNRKISPKKDDKRLHVDAFPATPTQGKRILRVFTNINQSEDRVWRLGEPFEQVAKHFIPRIKKPFPGSAEIKHLLKLTKTKQTKYDHYMLQLHDTIKADDNYQRYADQIEMRFPPNSTWIVQTDQVSHAAMSGQHLLEQTFYLPVEAMKNPLESPLKVLENLLASLHKSSSVRLNV